MLRSRCLYIILWMLFLNNTQGQNLFIENKGQTHLSVKYTKLLDNGALFYKSNGFTTLLRDNVAYDSMWTHYHKYKRLKHAFTIPYHRYDVNFLNSLPCDINASLASTTELNYFKGKIKATNVHMYHQVVYNNLYHNIDLQILEQGNAVKHNFILKPGAKTNDIVMQYRFVNGISLKQKSNGGLDITTSVGTVVEQAPLAFQLSGTDTQFVQCAYTLKKNKESWEVSFTVGTYDHTKQLIIDPLLIFATYSGSKGDNFGFTATHDLKANVYAAGIVDGNQGAFPVTMGAFQTTYGGGADIDPSNPGDQGRYPANLSCDIGINKYDSAGTVLLYSTYLGGIDDEYPHSLVTDNSDNLLIMGTTYSNDFPILTGCFDSTFNGETDIFIVKLSKNGSTMLGGTFMGGSNFDGLNSESLRYNYADDFRGDIAVDSNDNLYIASTTYSNDFPLLNAMQSTKGSKQDGCIFSFNPTLTALRFSTFAGGDGDDACYSIRLYDSFAYIGGGTASGAMNFTMNGIVNTYQGGRADGFIMKLKNDGSFRNATYYGTSAYDQVYFIDLDINGQIYAAGQTEGSITRTAGTYGKNNTSQFISRFSPNLANINLSTTFGNRFFNPEISPSAFLIDKCDNIYFSGWGSPIDYDGLHSLTTNLLPVTSGAIQSITDRKDFYLLVMNKDAKRLLYATYFGGNKTEDHVDGGTSRFDKRGVVYQAVCASCPDFGGNQDFPVTSSAPFTTNTSPRCNNAVFKIDFQITFLVDAKFTATPISGCEPLNVQFTNISKYGKKFFWDYGDGSPIDTTKSPQHIFMKKGKYKVKLSSIDSFSCNVAEFDSLEIEVLESPIADFTVESKPCESVFKFTNKSQNSINPYWNFGDSTNPNTDENPEHRYLKDGKFKVVLEVMHPTSGCKDTQSNEVQLFSDPSKSIVIPNVFTPGTDGMNDCFTIDGIDPNCDEARVWIYDRWGILVFNGYLPLQCWNGKLYSTGGELPAGVYYYLMTIKRKPQNGESTEPSSFHTNGVIHLIRD